MRKIIHAINVESKEAIQYVVVGVYSETPSEFICSNRRIGLFGAVKMSDDWIMDTD